MFVGKAIRLEHLKGASLWQAPASHTNIIQDVKGLPSTNTVAYYKHSEITDVKSFIAFVLERKAYHHEGKLYSEAI